MRLSILEELTQRGANLRFWSDAKLEKHAINHEGAVRAAAGQLVVGTAPNTGRSSEDKYEVRNAAVEDKIDWENVKERSQSEYDQNRLEALEYAAKLPELFLSYLKTGGGRGDCQYVIVISELAWHGKFMRNMLYPVKPFGMERKPLVILNLPGFSEFTGQVADEDIAASMRAVVDGRAEAPLKKRPLIVHDYDGSELLILFTKYGGEMKKGVFTDQLLRMPERGLLPLHASAVIDEDGNVYVFMADSMNGKSTTVAELTKLIDPLTGKQAFWGFGDDIVVVNLTGKPNAHGTIFNSERGGYFTLFGLTQASQPTVWHAIHQRGVVLENVPLTPDGQLDLVSGIANMRAAVPNKLLANFSRKRFGQIKGGMFLFADLEGVSRIIYALKRGEAREAYYRGIAMKMAKARSGSINVNQVTTNFSYANDFRLGHKQLYMSLFVQLLDLGVEWWLMNTGSYGGPHPPAPRYSIEQNNRVALAALTGQLEQDSVRYTYDLVMELWGPTSCPGVPDLAFDQARAWSDRKALLEAGLVRRELLHEWEGAAIK